MTPTPASGSTLIEMIVVLVIVGLIFGLAVPALTAVPRGGVAVQPADSAVAVAVARGRPVLQRRDSGRTLLALPDGRVIVGGGTDAR